MFPDKGEKNVILDFSAMETQVIPHFKGGEKEVAAQMYNDDLCRILRLQLAPGASVGEHTHEDSAEIIFALEGEAVVLYDGREERLVAGQCHYCPKGHTHTLRNEGPADFAAYAVVPQQ